MDKNKLIEEAFSLLDRINKILAQDEDRYIKHLAQEQGVSEESLAHLRFDPKRDSILDDSPQSHEKVKKALALPKSANIKEILEILET